MADLVAYDDGRVEGPRTLRAPQCPIRLVGREIGRHAQHGGIAEIDVRRLPRATPLRGDVVDVVIVPCEIGIVVEILIERSGRVIEDDGGVRLNGFDGNGSHGILQ